jgi:heme/copper-type cytochrome/quinol oxidase subunit 2
LENKKRMKILSGASLLFALLQSACAAVIAISGIRVAIGLTALAAASGTYAPARGLHQDAIRIPMLWVAALGAIVNLLVLAWIWHLRARPAAEWRRREIGAKERRSEILQVALAVVTLILVGLEVWTHPMVHRPGPAPQAQPVLRGNS